jgi:hypothetical protein
MSVLSLSDLSRLDNLVTNAIEVEMKEEPETPNRISELAFRSNLDPTFSFYKPQKSENESTNLKTAIRDIDCRLKNAKYSLSKLGQT